MRNSAICVLPGCDKLRRTEAVDVVVVRIANGCRARRLIPFRNRHSVVEVERLTFAIVCLNRIKLLVKILFLPLSLLRKLVLFIAQSLVDVASTDWMASSLYEMRRLQFVVLLASLSLSLYIRQARPSSARSLHRWLPAGRAGSCINTRLYPFLSQRHSSTFRPDLCAHSLWRFCYILPYIYICVCVCIYIWHNQKKKQVIEKKRKKEKKKKNEEEAIVKRERERERDASRCTKPINTTQPRPWKKKRVGSVP